MAVRVLKRCAGVTVLEDGEVGDGDADLGGQLDEGDASVCEERVEVNFDAVVDRVVTR